jgi:hypothetical protein
LLGEGAAQQHYPGRLEVVPVQRDAAAARAGSRNCSA